MLLLSDGEYQAIELHHHHTIWHESKRQHIFVYTTGQLNQLDKQDLAKHNTKYKYLLNVTDTLSKYEYSFSIKV